jgi:hypothetical protein
MQSEHALHAHVYEARKHHSAVQFLSSISLGALACSFAVNWRSPSRNAFAGIGTDSARKKQAVDPDAFLSLINQGLNIPISRPRSWDTSNAREEAAHAFLR